MPTFYLDMDGVVADWIKGATDIVGYGIYDPHVRYPDEDWEKIKEHGRIYKDLPLMPDADKIVDLARKFRDELGWELLFLTAVPRFNDVHWAFWDKVKWAEKYFPDIPVHFGPYSFDKYLHCKPGDILVDDRIDNCEQWKKSGGIAVNVKYDSYKTALKEIDDILEKKLALNRLSKIK